LADVRHVLTFMKIGHHVYTAELWLKRHFPMFCYIPIWACTTTSALRYAS